MKSLLSAARFGIPSLPLPYVPRPRLLQSLAGAGECSLTLVSAPAGTGKTTVVADWARRHVLRAPTGWVTFDDGDGSLWRDLLTCLGRLGVDVPQVPDRTTTDVTLSQSQLTALAAGVAAAPRRLTVVLDGYELTSPDEAHQLHYLLEHTQDRLGIVLVTRLDPVLPLYRYRLDGSLVEVRVADLAFTDAEAAALLRSAGVGLDDGAVHSVNTRVKGWAAGLRFAERALEGHEDPTVPAASAVLQDSDINEYLLGEVLDVQTPEVRRFLLETSVADVLSPSLVVELCGAEAEHLLSGLRHLNTFAEPVPGRPGCLRYYPFFKELLQAQLAYEHPQRWLELHRRAAQWCLHEDLPDRALVHLAAVQDWREVATLLVTSGRVGLLLSEGPLTGSAWAAASRIPRDLDLPEASVVRAAVALAGGDNHTCCLELDRARAQLGGTDPRVLQSPTSPAVSATVAVVDAVCAGLNRDAEQAQRLAEVAAQALDRARRTMLSIGSAGLVALVGRCRGIAALRCGDIRTARTLMLEALPPLSAPSADRWPASDPTTSSLGAEALAPALRADILGHLALIDALEGHLARATRSAEAALALADGRRPAAVCHGEVAAHLALGVVALERCHPKAARHHVSTATGTPALCVHPTCRGLAEAVLAGAERASGDLQGALVRLGAAADACATSDPWLADRLRLEAARLGLASGHPEVAVSALDSVGLQDVPEAAALAAATFVEEGRFDAVEDRLTHVRRRPASPRSEVVALLAESAKDLHQHAPGRARAALDRSLRLAAPEGLRRPFREGGPAVQRLLHADPAVLREHAWLSQSGSETPAGGGRPGAPSPLQVQRDLHGDHAPAPGLAPGMPVEELTAKELEVLHRLAELLTTEEIAGRMFISVNTVRTHVRNILRKLDVNRRNAAVRRARELGLLTGSGGDTADAS
jgi:LuxR family maltose regulon positive regulatory protein